MGRPAGTGSGPGWADRAAAAHLVQPGAEVVGLPDPGADGGDHHDRHDQQTAVTLVREREQGTGEQMTVSPLRRGELMVGKLLPWTLLAFADMLVIALVGIWVFDLPLRGSLGFLAASSVVFVFSALGVGLIISAVAPSLETANIVGLLIAFLPAFLLSGFAFPLESIPTRCSGSVMHSWPVHGDHLPRRLPQGRRLLRAVAGAGRAHRVRAGCAAGLLTALPQEVDMSLHRIRLIIWKEFLQLRRDPLLLRLIFIMPIVQLIFFGYVVSADVRNLATAVVDLDKSTTSRQLAASFSSSSYFTIEAYLQARPSYSR